MNSPINQGVMRLYDRQNNRLYINADERQRFTSTAEKQNERVRILCLVLAYTGCRISEALELTSDRILEQESLIVFRTLKTHGRHAFREVPVPAFLIAELLKLATNYGGYFWSQAENPLNRITAYRWIKQVMWEAGIAGPQACPKGLRHGFGIHATRVGVQLHMLQKWMGHTSMTTTAIYATAAGREEMEIAARMWD
jgi:integrase/recombinase XerD